MVYAEHERSDCWALVLHLHTIITDFANTLNELHVASGLRFLKASWR